MINNNTEVNPRKLLTKELMEKIEKRVRDLLDVAAAIWPDHTAKFQDAPEIRYDIKNRFGGVAISGGKDDWTIRLNLILCYENEAHFIEQTVGHEVAHLVQRVAFGSTKQVENKLTGKMETKKVQSHGPEWRSVMVKFGLEAARCHKYDTSSIQTKKRARAKSGAFLTAAQTIEMLKRLETGYRRLDSDAKRAFIRQCEAVLDGDTGDNE